MVHPGCSNHCGVVGYEAIDAPFTANYWGGLEFSGTSAVLDGSVSHGNWFYAVATTATFYDGIPGPESSKSSVRFEICSPQTNTAIITTTAAESTCEKVVSQASVNGIFPVKSVA